MEARSLKDSKHVQESIRDMKSTPSSFSWIKDAAWLKCEDEMGVQLLRADVLVEDDVC